MVNAHAILPNEGYLAKAESIYDILEKKFFNKKIYHSNLNSSSFLEDYAYSINCLIDLSEETLNPKYKIKANRFM